MRVVALAIIGAAALLAGSYAYLWRYEVQCKENDGFPYSMPTFRLSQKRVYGTEKPPFRKCSKVLI